MKDTVRAGDPVTLGAIISIKDAPFLLKKQIEEKRLPLAPDRIHLIPSRHIREILSGMTKQPVIMTGRYTAVLPAVFFEHWDNEYVNRFAVFLETALCKSNNRVEAELASSPPAIQAGREEDATFRLKSNREYMGLPVGEMEVHLSNQHVEHSEGESRPFDRPLALDEYLDLVVHQYIPVIMAGTTLEGNEELTWEKLIITEKELTPFRGEVLIPEEQITGLQTIKTIRPGEILYRSQVRKCLKVRAGEKIMITFLKGEITLSMTGRAGESGGFGDLVKVRPSQSAEWIIGQVTGSREVRIEMQ